MYSLVCSSYRPPERGTVGVAGWAERLASLGVTSRRDENRGDLSQTVERALRLLDLVASSPDPLTTAQLSSVSRVPRPTAHRLLLTLEHLGYVDRVRDHSFVLGYKATRMSGIHGAQQSLARRAAPTLAALVVEVDETVGLSTPVGNALVEIEQIDPPHPVRQMSYINVAFPLHCSSNGKMMLAGFAPEDLDAFLSLPLESRTARSIVDPERLRVDLAATRERQFGICLEELYEGINGVSVGIQSEAGRPIGYLSVSGPSFRFPLERLLEVVPALRRASEQISSALHVSPTMSNMRT